MLLRLSACLSEKKQLQLLPWRDLAKGESWQVATNGSRLKRRSACLRVKQVDLFDRQHDVIMRMFESGL